jgi:phage FluMu protein Com
MAMHDILEVINDYINIGTFFRMCNISKDFRRSLLTKENMLKHLKVVTTRDISKLYKTPDAIGSCLKIIKKNMTTRCRDCGKLTRKNTLTSLRKKISVCSSCRSVNNYDSVPYFGMITKKQVKYYLSLQPGFRPTFGKVLLNLCQVACGRNKAHLYYFYQVKNLL